MRRCSIDQSQAMPLLNLAAGWPDRQWR